MDAIKTLLARRNAAQPLGTPSCGSVFRNPPGDFAGRLIEQAGLKGRRLGGAMVSDKHANFIVNLSTATAADIEGLIAEVRAEVERTSGIALELEVRVIGEALDARAKGAR
jgi:UDP-N-acetylmuramate dehydrogenase